jgi:hypothetical protein
MVEEIIITIMNRNEYLKNPIEIGLDKDWTNKSVNFDERMKMQGIYIFHISQPQRIIYVGKTRGPTMDFRTRLYRHATESASQSNPKVYRALKKIKEETGSQILVSLLTTKQIQSLFKGKQLEDSALIDIYEQLLIHLLKPEIQEE